MCSFHLNVVPFFLQLLPKVVLANEEVFMELEAPVHFVQRYLTKFMLGIVDLATVM